MIRLYEDHQTFGTMFIVLRNQAKDTEMTVLDQVQDAQTTEQPKQQALSLSRLAAVVEAAYILEAVRK
jgi:hypothetical protein